MLGPWTYVELEFISNIDDIGDIPDATADRYIPPHIVNGNDFQALLDAREQAAQHIRELCQQDLDNISQFKENRDLFPARQQEYQQQLTQYTQQMHQFQAFTNHVPISDLDGLLKLATNTFAVPIQLYLKQVAANTTALDLKRLHKEAFTEAATERTDMEIDTEPPADMKHIKDLVAKLVTDQLNHQNQRIAKAAGTKVTQAVKKSLNAKNNQRGQSQGGASTKKKSPAKNNGNNRKDSTNCSPSRSSSHARCRSRSATRGRGSGRGRGGRGRNNDTAPGKGNATTGNSKSSNRGRSRSSSRGRKQNSGTRRSRSSRQSTRN